MLVKILGWALVAVSIFGAWLTIPHKDDAARSVQLRESVLASVNIGTSQQLAKQPHWPILWTFATMSGLCLIGGVSRAPRDSNGNARSA